jgi:hypothetical protein
MREQIRQAVGRLAKGPKTGEGRNRLLEPSLWEEDHWLADIPYTWDAYVDGAYARFSKLIAAKSPLLLPPLARGEDFSINFDSERSRSERDFRIYTNPSNWGKVRDFCLKNMAEGGGRELELDPTRELVEEFDDTLGIQLKPGQYIVDPYNIVVENEPAPTSNVRASGAPTARIYRVYEVRILDRDLCRAMISNSEAHPGQVLRAEALDDAHKGGLGRANAVLVAAEEEIRAAFLNVPPERRGEVLPFADTLLEGNVAAVIEGIYVPKYQQIGQ